MFKFLKQLFIEHILSGAKPYIAFHPELGVPIGIFNYKDEPDYQSRVNSIKMYGVKGNPLSYKLAKNLGITNPIPSYNRAAAEAYCNIAANDGNEMTIGRYHFICVGGSPHELTSSSGPATGAFKYAEKAGKTRTPNEGVDWGDLEKMQEAFKDIAAGNVSLIDQMDVILDMLALEDTIRVDISQSIGMSNKQLFDTIEELNEAGVSSAKWAITVDQLFNTFKAMTMEVGRKLRIPPEVTERAALLTKTLAGFDAGQFAAAFDTIGFSLNTAIGEATDGIGDSNTAMTDIIDTGRQFGVVMEKFMGNVVKDLKLVNTYGFERGVEGLARMVARGQSLGLEMSTVSSLADKFFDPEGAIDFAARMQVIGGAVGDLADPFKLMYMATNDLEGLQTAIMDTAAAAVTFDEDKNKFVISPESRRQLKDMAEAMGMSYQDLADHAVKAARRAEVFSEMKFLDNVSDDDKELISSMAQMGEGGEMQVKIPSIDKMVDVDRLTPEQIEELKQLNLSDQEFYEQQLTVAEKANQYLATIDTGIRKMVRKGGDQEGAGDMAMASLSQQLGESMELLTTEQLDLIAKGDMKGFLANFEAHPPAGIGDKAAQTILDGLQNMGMISPNHGIVIEDDFILRPGMAPVSFNEDDIILGGTNLDGGQGDITNSINNVNNSVTTTTGGGGARKPLELTGTLTVKGEGESATINVKRLLAQLSSGDLQNLSIMLSNATT
tara:strand:- start:12019 stop:14184 length:2166 start_codon:yes stop_codon:yes gene_type:complete